MSVEIRTVSDDEVSAYRHCLLQVFGDDLDSDPDGDNRVRALIPAAQRWAAFDGSQIVATAGTFDHAIGIPGGGTLPMAGLTMVTVRPTHRRKGILRQLIGAHLADARARGYAISGLWATEPGIYTRFGYGLAACADVITIDESRTLELRDRELDSIELVDDATARDLLPAVYARATAARPGALRRSDVWWKERRFLEAPFVRAGASKRRHVIARRDGEIVGYLVYRQRGAFDPTKPNGKVEINELLGIDARAELSLWQFAVRIDLFPNVSWWNAPTDDTLLWAVKDPRRISRRRTDTLWLRIDDVAATLDARTYPTDGKLVFDSHGATWELVVSGGRGTCKRSMGTPSLRFAETALASVFLGTEAPTRLARAELVTGSPAALALADKLFASAIAPWCPEVF